MKTTVVHVRDRHDVYIGRPNPRSGLPDNKWKNRNRISSALSRSAAIVMYERDLRCDIAAGKITRQDLESLQGKRLACWCKPEACHGDVLARYVERADVVTMTHKELFHAIKNRIFPRWVLDGSLKDEGVYVGWLRDEFLARVQGVSA